MLLLELEPALELSDFDEAAVDSDFSDVLSDFVELVRLAFEPLLSFT